MNITTLLKIPIRLFIWSNIKKIILKFQYYDKNRNIAFLWMGLRVRLGHWDNYGFVVSTGEEGPTTGFGFSCFCGSVQACRYIYQAVLWMGPRVRLGHWDKPQNHPLIILLRFLFRVARIRFSFFFLNVFTKV